MTRGRTTNPLNSVRRGSFLAKVETASLTLATPALASAVGESKNHSHLAKTNSLLSSCPGSHLADSTLFITCATSLAVLNVDKHVEGGKPVMPVHDYTTGTIRFVAAIQPGSISDWFHSHPKEFKCTITPRSEKAWALLQGIE